MYDYGTKVYVKSLDFVGTVEERGRHRSSGRAWYVVWDRDGRDYMTGSADLRRADFCCDGCGRWLPYGSVASRANTADDSFQFCFLCVKDAEKERYQHEAA